MGSGVDEDTLNIIAESITKQGDIQFEKTPKAVEVVYRQANDAKYKFVINHNEYEVIYEDDILEPYEVKINKKNKFVRCNMAIIFNESTKEFHLFNNEISYIIKVMKNNQLENLYFGKKITHRECFNHLIEREPNTSPCCYEGEQAFSLDHIKQEYPSYGTTDYRYPSHQITRENGSNITNFEYVAHHIYKGKKSLKAPPCTYVEDENEATTLEIKLFDNVLNVELMLSYTIFENYGIITKNASFVNIGEENLVLNSAMSASLDLPDDNYEMIHLAGAWARERHIKTRKLQPGVQAFHSIRGASSSNHNPFLALKRPKPQRISVRFMDLALFIVVIS